MHKLNRGEHCFYYGESEENPAAIIRWTPSVKNVLIIEETRVNDDLQGKGIARKLVERVAKMAREEDYKLIASCAYAKKILEGNEKYRDILAPRGSHY